MGPLDGLKVVDLTTMVSGPVAAMMLADEGLPVIGVPKTIDNDIAGTDTTFGFATAVQIASDAIDRLATTAEAHNRIIVVDQSWPFAGISSEVITQVCENCFDWLDHQPVRVNTEDVPTPYAKGLEYAYLPNPERIVDAVRNILP